MCRARHAIDVLLSSARRLGVYGDEVIQDDSANFSRSSAVLDGGVPALGGIASLLINLPHTCTVITLLRGTQESFLCIVRVRRLSTASSIDCSVIIFSSMVAKCRA